MSQDSAKFNRMQEDCHFKMFITHLIVQDFFQKIA